MNWKVPFADIRLGDEEKAAVLEVIESNWLTMGPKTKEFETAFADAMNVPSLEAVSLTNCTAALHLALQALGLGPGDEVIVPSLTFVATVNAVRYTGAAPVLADIVSDDEWNIDPKDIESKISPRTKAIVVMHYAGYPVRMDAVLEIAKRHKLFIVEDACHGPLSKWNGHPLGTIGDAGCFSFFSNKNMTTGEGGMLVTRDPKLAEKVRLLRSHGMTSNTYARYKGHAFGYDVVDLGYNYRIDEMRAAMGIVQLRALHANNQRRGHLIGLYRKQLAAALPDVKVPFADWVGDYAYHIFPVLIPKIGPERGQVMAGMSEAGVQTSIHYRPVHWLSAYKDMPGLPRIDAIAERILTLPLYHTMSDEDVEYVVASLAKVLKS
jgi:dTDP-4-amino-4,6-dideoxygalactose transaminase